MTSCITDLAFIVGRFVATGEPITCEAEDYQSVRWLLEKEQNAVAAKGNADLVDRIQRELNRLDRIHKKG
jgi:hypothetical protein